MVTTTVHCLRGGSALCGLKGPAHHWPESHQWLSPEAWRVYRPQADVKLCSGCRSAFDSTPEQRVSR